MADELKDNEVHMYALFPTENSPASSESDLQHISALEDKYPALTAVFTAIGNEPLLKDKLSLFQSKPWFSQGRSPAILRIKEDTTFIDYDPNDTSITLNPKLPGSIATTQVTRLLVQFIHELQRVRPVLPVLEAGGGCMV